jgi:1,4-alpha-glucan branching enzyme
MTGEGRVVIVLHTHMPYVEGFGTWPFGEEWLWEAVASSYLPLLELLDDGAPITLSLTPVLGDQLAAPGLLHRFQVFVEEIRDETHARDVASLSKRGETALAEEVRRAAGDYRWALERLQALRGDLLGALAGHARWTSAATHAVLPLLASDAGVRLQLRAGIDAHRARSGGWGGGLWLPECAYAPWLDPLLEQAGVHATCVDLTDHFGLGDERHLRPWRGRGGPLLVPIDRAIVELVWSEHGYPADPAYRDYHALSEHHHHPWANGGVPYQHQAALERAHAHARDFVRRLGERVADGGLCVCALDTELLGHWWYEGPTWLGAVVREASAAGLALVTLDQALSERDAQDAPPEGFPCSTWGAGRDLSTWSGPAVADMAWAVRAGELQVLRAAPSADAVAVRELLAAQSSDWAFLVARDLARPYGRERQAGHLERLRRALAGEGDPDALRGLAPYADPSALLEP